MTISSKTKQHGARTWAMRSACFAAMGALVSPIAASAQDNPQGALSFGLSHSSFYGTRGSVDLTIEDLWLDGLSLSARLQSGELGQGGSLAVGYDWDIEQPVFGFDTQAFVAFEASGQDWDPLYSLAEYELVLGLRSTVAPNLVAGVELVWNETNLSDFDGSVSPVFLNDQGSSTSAGFRFGLEYDNRESDRLIAPGTTGIFEIYAPVLGDDDRNFVRIDGRLGYTVPVYNSVTLKVAAAAGVVVADDTDMVNLLDRTFTAQGFPRGFDYGGAGPRDTSTNTVLGGTQYVAGSVELLVPINDRDWTIGSFYDIGGVWDVPGVSGANILEDRYDRSSYGLSLNVPTGIGDLRISYAQPDNALATDELNELSFSLNGQF
jgi:outer membrane protein assembly factor BamA